ncbi:MAG TPA: PIN domain-containing protein [Vicinamibacteria bacterium]|nr:PIN domain-containing protein [Vicinamibacteria bacterium]
MNPEKFHNDLRRFESLGLDSAVLIYHLEDVEPYSELTELIFSAVASGSAASILSTISLTELLVKPFAEDRTDAIERIERFILALPKARIVAPTYAIAKEAARLRGKYRIRTPDALLVSTAIHEGAKAFVTNDDRLKRVGAEGIRVLVLDQYVSSKP